MTAAERERAKAHGLQDLMVHQLRRDHPAQAARMLAKRAGQLPGFTIDDPAQHEKAETIGGFPEVERAGGDGSEQRVTPGLTQAQQITLRKTITAHCLDHERFPIDTDAPRTKRD